MLQYNDKLVANGCAKLCKRNDNDQKDVRTLNPKAVAVKHKCKTMSLKTIKCSVELMAQIPIR